MILLRSNRYLEKVTVQGVITFDLQEIELAAQGNVNSIPLSHRVTNLLTVDGALKPEELGTLQLPFDRLMSLSSSRPDYNRNSLPGKDTAADISFDSEIMVGDKFGYSASDMAHNKKIECRLADVETKLAKFQPLHEELIRSRQISAEQIKADQVQVQVLRDDVAKIQSDFGEIKSLFQRQFTQMFHFLNMQTQYRVLEELSRFKVDMEERIQTLEQRSQSLEVMVDKLTKTITKLHLVCEVCGAPKVQGAP